MYVAIPVYLSFFPFFFFHIIFFTSYFLYLVALVSQFRLFYLVFFLAFCIYIMDLFAQYRNSGVFTFKNFVGSLVIHLHGYIRNIFVVVPPVFHLAPIYAVYASVVMMLFIICLSLSRSLRRTVDTFIL